MPYIKKEIQNEKMQRLVRGYGFNGPTLAAVLGCSIPTALKKLGEPQRFTLGDLRALNRKGHIPMEEIRGAIEG